MFAQSSITKPTESTNFIGDIIPTNAVTHLPLKLTLINFSAWKTRFETLMLGYDLYVYLDGLNQCSPKLLTDENKTISNPSHRLWRKQDAFIRHAILSSSTPAIHPSLNGVETTAQAWTKLNENMSTDLEHVISHFEISSSKPTKKGRQYPIICKPSKALPTTWH